MDIFAAWTHWIATNPLGEAYRTDLAFPPVMVYVFWILGIVEPAFRTVADAADPGVRLVLKVPALLADAGLAVGVAYLLRDRPRWAVAAAFGVLLSPVVIYTSAWWGQFESIYVLAGLVAAILAIGGRPQLAAVALGVALMAKPQALAFVPPFVAWAAARSGWRSALLSGVVVAGTVVVLWLPFIADGGPMAYLTTLSRHQTQVFPIMSLRAWNPWWVFQTLIAGDDFVADGGALIGPLSPRLIGYLFVALLEIIVMRAVWRAPTKRGLLIGLAASTLVLFGFLTSVHERYAYAALIFLAPLIPDRRILADVARPDRRDDPQHRRRGAAHRRDRVAAADRWRGRDRRLPGDARTHDRRHLAPLDDERHRPAGWDGEYDRAMATTGRARAPSAGP